ncbi:MAG: enoyl-CoA hydratase/isomerase family protein [Candidatus Hodarchaeota archaeon]
MSEKKYEYIIYNLENGIGTITLNRPNQLNALKYQLIMEIVDILESSMKKKSIRVFVIEGSGRAFCSGDDLKGMGDEGPKFKPLEDGSRIPHQRMIRLIRKIQKPVIALLHGYCLGAGFELALACDFRLAADNLQIGDHRASRAICMMSGASWFLPRIVGFARATEIILTGRHLDAKEALEIGLVTKVYPFAEFKEKSQEFIRKIAELPTRCLGFNKAMLNFSQFNELFPSLQYELDLYIRNMATYDHFEGVKSFLEKRAPKYKGK